MGHFEGAADNVSSASQRIGDLAGSVKLTANDARTFFDQGKTTLQSVDGLATDMRVTDQRINKILEHPGISQDLKDVITKAQVVSQQISATVNQLNNMLGNDATRQDLITVMTKLSDSTNNIEHSLETLNKMSTDKDLRSDLKHIISQASEALDKAHALLDKNGANGTDLRGTIAKVKSAATNVDIAAQELQEALQHKRPLMHLMFGKGVKVPASGEVLVVPADVKTKSSTTKTPSATTSTTTTITTPSAIITPAN